MGYSIYIDLPDQEKRRRYGNNFTPGSKEQGPHAYDKGDRAGVSLWYSEVYPDEDRKASLDVGRLEMAKDGVGMRYKATAIASYNANGPIDWGYEYGTAELGAKAWEEDVGLDMGIKMNASAARYQVGMLRANFGVGADTGVKCGKEGVGIQVLGTGFEVGRTTKLSVLGTSVTIKFW
uniref:Uncharacterized protein n=1 Tax=Plectus sambesii TaxID=2011161 RepID=A0A914XJR5_9BILA